MTKKGERIWKKKNNFKYEDFLNKINELEIKSNDYEKEIEKEIGILYKEFLKDCKTYSDFYEKIRYLKAVIYDAVIYDKEYFLTDFKRELFLKFETRTEKTIKNAKIPFEKGI